MKNYRERTCNFCDFSSRCGIPDGVICSEEHHQQGKDMFQYVGKTGCEYFKDDKKNDAYDKEKSRREYDENYKKVLIETIENTKREIKDKEDELKSAETRLKFLIEEIG